MTEGSECCLGRWVSDWTKRSAAQLRQTHTEKKMVNHHGKTHRSLWAKQKTQENHLRKYTQAITRGKVTEQESSGTWVEAWPGFYGVVDCVELNPCVPWCADMGESSSQPATLLSHTLEGETQRREGKTEWKSQERPNKNKPRTQLSIFRKLLISCGNIVSTFTFSFSLSGALSVSWTHTSCVREKSLMRGYYLGFYLPLYIQVYR